MSASIRAALLFLPLIGFALLGSLYHPDAYQEPGADTADAELASLPPLPSWAQDSLPDFSGYSDVTEKKAAFFAFLYPRIVLVNSRVLIERQNLLTLRDKPALSDGELNWLTDQATRLRVDAEPGSDAMFIALTRRLDAIPPSLILAQAANESAWGTSRFARKGNNLFGQWCFSKGCGLVPASRVEGATHEVAQFGSPYGSVRAYVENLNSHPSYSTLRKLRIEHRTDGKRADGISLAAGLVNYSERGQPYVHEIRGMIRFNNLKFYDQQFGKSINSAEPQTLNNLVTTAQSHDLLPSVVSEDNLPSNAASEG